MRSEDQLLANKSTRRSRGLLFDNNWSFDRIIYGCLSSLAKKIPILKICTRGIRLIISWIEWNQTHYFLFQNNKKKSGTDIFYQIIAHVHFREILSGYFLFSRFDWSIFVTQLVAKHMKEIINGNLSVDKYFVKIIFDLLKVFLKRELMWLISELYVQAKIL
jgi:hypothetical protein